MPRPIICFYYSLKTFGFEIKKRKMQQQIRTAEFMAKFLNTWKHVQQACVSYCPDVFK